MIQMYPPSRPDVKVDYREGRLRHDVKVALKDRLQVKTIVELGSWTGLATRFMLQHSMLQHSGHDTTIYCIDTWELPGVYDRFVSGCWSLQDQIVPVQASTQEGMDYLHEIGVVPDLVYVDASHEYEYEDVLSNIRTIRQLWPDAHIVGSEAYRESVINAIKDSGEDCEVNGDVWTIH